MNNANYKIFFPFSYIKLFYNRKFSKNDIILKNYIIKQIITNQDKEITLTQKELNKILKLNTYETVDEFMDKFKIKHYTFHIETDNTYDGFFNILDGFIKTNDVYKLIISSTFFDIFTNPTTELKEYKLDTLLKFSNTNISSLYSFLQNFTKDGKVRVNLQQLKYIMDIEENKYTRFFDFEKLILKPCINEIEKYTNLKITYSKLKQNNKRNEKVMGILFNIKDLTSEILDRRINKIGELIKVYCKNYDIILKFIKKELEEKTFIYILENTQYALMHPKNNFELSLISAIKYNSYKNEFNKKVQSYLNTYKIITYETLLLNNKTDFYNLFIKELGKYDIKQLSKIIPFLKQLFDLYDYSITLPSSIKENRFYNEIFLSLDKKNEFIFKEGDVIILGEYNGILNSNFCILLKIYSQS